MMQPYHLGRLLAAGTVFCVLAVQVSAETPSTAQPSDQNYQAAPLPQTNLNYNPGYDSISDYFTHWFDRVDRAQEEQPHWVTPIITVTPRLEEELRYDQYWQTAANGAHITNYGAGKGLELIPTETQEIIIIPPSYLTTTNVRHPSSGFADWPVFLFKQRLLTANEENGNYILTFFLSGSVPTGSPRYTLNTYVVTPTIAGGVGWGDRIRGFDIQATIGTPYATNDHAASGSQIITNITLQPYYAPLHLYGEFSITDINFLGGVRQGKNEIFLFPGIIIGRIHLYDRLKLTAGFGYQFAVSPHTTLDPLTPTYNHAWILSVRLPF